MRRTAWLFWPFGLMCCLAAPPALAADYPALVGGNPVLRQRESPTLADADRWFTQYVENYARTLSEQTRGHGSHTVAALWKHLLAELLAASDGRSG